MKSNWIVKFTRKGFEPPMPFGKTSEVVAAHSRAEAIAIVKQSGMVSDGHYPISASKTVLRPVSYYFEYSKDESYNPAI